MNRGQRIVRSLRQSKEYSENIEQTQDLVLRTLHKHGPITEEGLLRLLAKDQKQMQKSNPRFYLVFGEYDHSQPRKLDDHLLNLYDLGIVDVASMQDNNPRYILTLKAEDELKAKAYLY